MALVEPNYHLPNISMHRNIIRLSSYREEIEYESPLLLRPPCQYFFQEQGNYYRFRKETRGYGLGHFVSERKIRVVVIPIAVSFTL